MASQTSGDFRLNVLNPGGNDPEQDFSQEQAEATAHAPVNFHAYAACTGGRFLREVKRAVAAQGPVLLLLRGDFRASERALLALKKAGVPVAVSLKETGLHQIAEQLDEKSRLSRFLRIVRGADGYIAPTPEAADFCRTVRDDGKVAFIPTPYPLHDERWNFSRPIAEREGIMIGTREWDIPTRNHAAALIAAYRISEATGEPVTTYNCDGRREERLLARLDFRPGQLTVHNREDAYRDYLPVMAAHKIVFQLDSSFVPGQVAGDALLCRLPCVGGNGTIERIAFPELCGHDRLAGPLVETTLALLQDSVKYLTAISDAQTRAAERLSFPGAARQLGEFFSGIASPAWATPTN